MYITPSGADGMTADVFPSHLKKIHKDQMMTDGFNNVQNWKLEGSIPSEIHDFFLKGGHFFFKGGHLCLFVLVDGHK